MRRTLTLDSDVDAALLQAVRESGRSYKEVVNKTLRNGLLLKENLKGAPRFRVDPIPMGLKPGIDLRSISSLEARLEEEAGR